MRRSIPTALSALAALTAACADAPTVPSLTPTPVSAKGGPAAAVGGLVYGLTADDQLIRFDPAKPNQVSAERSITGLQPGERLVGIDFRPSNVAGSTPGTIGRLYAVSTASRIYTIDPATGHASFVATLQLDAVGGPVVPLSGTAFGLGFNPVPDRLRLHSDLDQNLRINVDNGVTIVDGPLQYVDGSGNPTLVATGYTNNDNDPATGTVLYAIDAERDALARFDNPNAGTARLVGPLGVATGVVAGFDIALAGNSAYAALSNSASGKSTLYTIDLTSGAATKLGLIAQSKSPLVSIAVQP
jgi:hypothetical protein